MNDDKLTALLISRINQLENVEFREDVGIVRMYSKGKWHNLFWVADQMPMAGDLDAVYEFLEIRINHNNLGIVNVLFSADVNNKQTISNELIKVICTEFYLGVIDGQTNEYIQFPPLTYKLNNIFYDGDFNKLANDGYIREKPTSIVSFYFKVHVINRFSVLTVDEAQINGDYIRIDDKDYELFSNGDDNRLCIGGIEKIQLLKLYDYRVKCETDEFTGITTARGLIIPNYRKLTNVFEIDGIWLGEIDFYRLELICPVAPNSGKRTKPAIAF